MGKRVSGVLIALAVLTAACDAGDDDPATDPAGQNGRAAATTVPVVTETTTVGDDSLDETAPESPDVPCADVEQRTLETAVEAFYAQKQRFPTDMVELVTEGFLRVEYTGFEIGADGSIVRDRDMSCLDGGEGATDDQGRPTTVNAWLEWFGADFVAAVGGIACATEAAALMNATAEYERINAGFAAQTFADIEPYLDRPIGLWVLDDPGDAPTPTAGSGCSSEPFGGSDVADQCRVEHRTIRTAIEAFVAVEGEGRPPTEDDLVGTYLRDPLDGWFLDGWEVVATPESDCALLECDAERRTLETAVEAFMAEEGSERPPTEDELVGSYLREPFDNWDLDGWEVVRAPGSPCSHGASCGVVLGTVETAVEAYYAGNGVWPTSIDELVGTYLRSDEEIELVELRADGHVRPAPGSICETG